MDNLQLIPGYDGYAADAAGRIYSNKRGGWRILNPSIMKRGYLCVNIRKNDAKKSRPTPVHKLVLLAFAGPRPSGCEGCHNDGNKMNNRVENLRWDTREKNMADRRIHGNGNEGSKHGMSKLSERDVLEIRKLASKGMAQKLIADRKNVSKTTIHFIVRKKRWTHI